MLCQICNQKKANSKHIATHGMTFDEYLQQYEPETYWKRRTVEQINGLYVTARFRFVESNANYTATVKKQDRGYGLTDKDLMNHLDGKKTIAVYTPSEKTKFLSFDVDVLDVAVLERLIEVLSAYIPRESILCSFSGGKGYHADIFFDRLIDKDVAKQFYLLVLSETGYDAKAIECRGAENTALKLPLGFHAKTGNYCYLCNEYGVEIKDDTHGYKTFCEIKPIDGRLIHEAVEVNYSADYFTDDEITKLDELKNDVKMLPVYSGDVEYKRTSIEKLIETGLHQTGERHQTTYKIAVYLKEEGFSSDEAKQFLKDWTLNKCNKALYNSSLKEIEQDIKDTVNSVYRNDYKLKADAREVDLNKMEMKEILSVSNLPLSRLYFILYTHCKAFGDNQGSFYMTYEQMEQAGAAKGDRRHLKSQIDRLAELGKVEVIQRNKRVEGKKESLPNQYRIKALEGVMTVVVSGKTFSPCRQQQRRCADCTACHLLSKKEIAECYGRKTNDVLKLKRTCKKSV